MPRIVVDKKKAIKQVFVNPITNRRCQIGGVVHKKLIKDGILNNTLEPGAINVNTDAMNERMASMREAKRIKSKARVKQKEKEIKLNMAEKEKKNKKKKKKKKIPEIEVVKEEVIEKTKSSESESSESESESDSDTSE